MNQMGSKGLYKSNPNYCFICFIRVWRKLMCLWWVKNRPFKECIYTFLWSISNPIRFRSTSHVCLFFFTLIWSLSIIWLLMGLSQKSFILGLNFNWIQAQLIYWILNLFKIHQLIDLISINWSTPVRAYDLN